MNRVLRSRRQGLTESTRPEYRFVPEKCLSRKGLGGDARMQEFTCNAVKSGVKMQYRVLSGFQRFLSRTADVAFAVASQSTDPLESPHGQRHFCMIS